MSPKRKTVIVDLSGTVADTRHRLHHVRPANGEQRDYAAYHSRMGADAPIMPVVNLVRALAHDNQIVVVTDRPGTHWDATHDWLQEHAIPYDELHMRAEGDHTPGPQYKKGVLDYLRSQGHQVLLAVEDRPEIVDMWRANGVHCLQTAVN